MVMYFRFKPPLWYQTTNFNSLFIFCDVLPQEKHFSSAVRTELDLRRNVTGSATACHAANHELLEIKVGTALPMALRLGSLCLYCTALLGVAAGLPVSIQYTVTWRCRWTPCLYNTALLSVAAGLSVLLRVAAGRLVLKQYSVTWCSCWAGLSVFVCHLCLVLL